MRITVESTTDSKEQVLAATAGRAAAQAEPAVEKSASDDAAEVQETKKAKASDETPETSDTSDEVEAKAETESDEEHDQPARKGFKKRIDKLTKRAAEAEREREYWRQEALKAQAIREAKSEETKPEAKAEGMPQPDDFESHADYVRAVAKWEIKQELKAEKEQAQKAEIQKEFSSKRERFAKQSEEIAKAESDFEEVMDGVEGIPMSPALQSIFLESDQGARLAYELARNPDEFRRVNSLSPLAAAREIGKIEARLARESEAKKETKETKTTKAPMPITPVGAKSTGAVHKPFEEMSFEEYKRYRQKQLG